MSKKVKVGLIGAGFVGDIHHAAFNDWVHNAEVIAVANGNHPHARGACLLDGQVHCLHRDDVAHSPIPVHHGHRRSLSNNCDIGPRVDSTLFEAWDVGA